MAAARWSSSPPCRRSTRERGEDHPGHRERSERRGGSAGGATGRRLASPRGAMDTLHVLVLNCGSSSLKFQLLAMPGEDRLAHGVVERVRGDYADAIGDALDKAATAGG